MEFNSLFFILLFLPLFIGLMFFIKNNNVRNILLPLFSIIFYCLGDIKHIHILLIVFLITYLSALKVKNNRRLYVLYLILVVGILSYFKYGTYIIEAFKSYLKDLNFFKIVMPLGISFYTFTSISYVSDVFYEKYDAEKNPLKIFTFLSFFPVVISGPLIRCDSFKEYLKNKNISVDSIANGFRRFIIGLSKKVIIANQLNIISTTVINGDTKISFLLAWYALIAYGIQEFYDFSGYSDMAIGIGEMIGFVIPENFNDPYFSHSIAEYWRRWHMSLGKWFNDYVFMPVSTSAFLRKISKKFKNKKVGRSFIKIISLLAVWLLTGIWHGSSANYVIWGLINGLIIICDSNFSDFYRKILAKLKINSDGKLWKAFQIIRTMLIIFLMKSLIFKCTNIVEITNLTKGLLGIGERFSMSYIKSLDILYLLFYLILSFIFLFPAVHSLFKIINKNVYDILLLLLLVVSICFIVSGSYSAFIYFSF